MIEPLTRSLSDAIDFARQEDPTQTITANVEYNQLGGLLAANGTEDVNDEATGKWIQNAGRKYQVPKPNSAAAIVLLRIFTNIPQFSSRVFTVPRQYKPTDFEPRQVFGDSGAHERNRL